MSIPNTAAIFTVSRLNQSVRSLLEREMGQIWIRGEISNFSQPSSGHWYFTLKDNTAQVRCAMFRGSNGRVTFRPQHGQQVVVRANITLYEPRGDYQIIVESMQQDGEGLLQQQYEQLKQRLDQEGLFLAEHKRPLPSAPQQVGVITSQSGAALHDILHVLKRRDPALPVIIYPTAVQGVDAPMQIVRAISDANQRQECDVLILGRGGGSLEDLWSFNDERVARAIFASRIPIVSAVGHETDVTIADFVADLRAPTPSAAAEMVSRNQTELLHRLRTLQQRLEMAMDYSLAQRSQRVSRLHHRLAQQHPELRLARQHAALERYHQRMIAAAQRHIQIASQRQQRATLRLNRQQPDNAIHLNRSQLTQLEYRLTATMNDRFSRCRQRFGQTLAQLEAISPLATLARGFSVTRHGEGQVVKHTTQVQLGERLSTRVDDGWIDSEVTGLRPIDDKQKRQ